MPLYNPGGGIATPVSYANGGTNATTQAGARSNLGGSRVAATWSSVYATAADWNGQPGISNDGSVGIYRLSAGGTEQGRWESDVVWQPGVNYFKTAAISVALTQSGGTSQLKSLTVDTGNFAVSAGNVTVTDGEIIQTNTATNEPAGTYVSGNTSGASPWTYRNSASTGLSNSDWLQDDAIGGITIGTGNSGTSARYARKGRIETFYGLAGGLGGKSMPLIFAQYGEYGGVDGMHTMIKLDSDAGMTFYKFADASEDESAGAAMTIAASGLVTATSGITIGGGTTASELRFLEPSGSGSNYTAFKAQAQSADLTYTLPASQGTAYQRLINDGSGGLSWSGSVLYSATTDQTIANETETVINTVAIPAGLVADGVTLSYHLICTLTNTGAGTLTPLLKIGGTDVINDATVSIGSGTQTRPCQLRGEIDFDNLSGGNCTARVTLMAIIGTASSATTGVGDLGSTPAPLINIIHGSTSITEASASSFFLSIAASANYSLVVHSVKIIARRT